MTCAVDTPLERSLVQQLAELRQRVQHAEMTNRERRKDVMVLNRQLDTYSGDGEYTRLYQSIYIVQTGVWFCRVVRAVFSLWYRDEVFKSSTFL